MGCTSSQFWNCFKSPPPPTTHVSIELSREDISLLEYLQELAVRTEANEKLLRAGLDTVKEQITEIRFIIITRKLMHDCGQGCALTEEEQANLDRELETRVGIEQNIITELKDIELLKRMEALCSVELSQGIDKRRIDMLEELQGLDVRLKQMSARLQTRIIPEGGNLGRESVGGKEMKED